MLGDLLSSVVGPPIALMRILPSYEFLQVPGGSIGLQMMGNPAALSEQGPVQCDWELTNTC